jgi:hypothetical protein
MRNHYLSNFDEILIDNLNGDKFRTGKTAPDGQNDPSVFSTDANREGIQPGVAITTLMKTGSISPATVSHRSLWGVGKLSQLRREAVGPLETPYISVLPERKLGIPFADFDTPINISTGRLLPCSSNRTLTEYKPAETMYLLISTATP